MWLDLAVGLPTKAGLGLPSVSWHLRLFARAYRKAFWTLFWRYVDESLTSVWGVVQLTWLNRPALEGESPAGSVCGG